MNYFLDFEFLEDGQTIMPISLGIVCEDDSSLYLEFNFDEKKANDHDFVREHVLPHLRSKDYRIDKSLAKSFILNFIGQDKEPIFWAYYADYDWVVLCQIFGTMMDLPKHFPKLCMDLQQWWIMIGRPKDVKPKDPENAHHALADAKWNHQLWKSLKEYSNRKNNPGMSNPAIFGSCS